MFRVGLVTKKKSQDCGGRFITIQKDERMENEKIQSPSN